MILGRPKAFWKVINTNPDLLTSNPGPLNSSAYNPEPFTLNPTTDAVTHESSGTGGVRGLALQYKPQTDP